MIQEENGLKQLFMQTYVAGPRGDGNVVAKFVQRDANARDWDYAKLVVDVPKTRQRLILVNE